MRRLLAIFVLVGAASIIAGCTSSSAESTSPNSTSSHQAGGENTAAASACASLSKVVTADIGPIGSALGVAVGDGIAHNSSGEAKAEASATTLLRKLGTDIATTAADSNDPALRSAAAATSKNLDALLSDPEFFANIKTIGDIADATSKLQTAIKPITTACQLS